MSLGNGNPKYGDKGSNFNYEYAVLKLLNAIKDASGGGGGGDASAANQQTQITEALAANTQLVAIKTAIETFDSQNGADLTALLTELQTFATQNNTDLGTVVSQLQGLAASNLTALQAVETAVQTFDAQNGTDLAAILTALQNGDQLANIRSNTAKDGSGTALYPLLDADGHLQVDILSGGGGGDASAANQLSMITELQQIEAELAGGIDVSMAAVTVTPNLVRATGAGTIASGARSFSIANLGAADADILGGTNNLKVGEVVNFDAGLNNTYGAVAYDATGTELLITYNN